MTTAKYLEGECHVMAVALHRHLGTSFLLACENTKDYVDRKTGRFIPTVHHVYALSDQGKVLDVQGEKDAEDTKSQWISLGDEMSRNPFRTLEVADEEQLSRFVGDEWDLPLTAYSDEDVENAWTVFCEQHPSLANFEARQKQASGRQGPAAP